MKENSILGYLDIFGYWDDVSRADVQWYVANGGSGFFFQNAGPLKSVSPQYSRNNPATPNPRFSSRGLFPAPRVLFTEPRLPAHLVGLGDVGIYQLYWDMLGYVGIHLDMLGYIGIFGYLWILGYWGIGIYLDILGRWDRMRCWIYLGIWIYFNILDTLGYIRIRVCTLGY